MHPGADFTSEIVSLAPLELTQLLRRQFRRRLDVVGGNAQSPGNRFEGGRRPSPSPRITATARAARCDFVSPLQRRPALAVDRGVSGLTPANCNRYDSTSIIDIAPGLSGRVAFQRRPVPSPAAGPCRRRFRAERELVFGRLTLRVRVGQKL